jgi:RNA recognition motif-containing protein
MKLPTLPTAGPKLLYKAVRIDKQSMVNDLSMLSVEPVQEHLSESVEGQLMVQCEYYFSDANMVSDKFLINLLAQGDDDMIPVAVLTSFKKVKKLLNKHSNRPPKHIEVLVNALRLSTKLVVSEEGTRVGRKEPLPQKADEESIAQRTVKVDNLPKNSTQESIRLLFEKYSEVLSVSIPSKFEGSAKVVLGSLAGSIRACEGMNDDSNWRSGLRVQFDNGWSIPHAKKEYNKLLTSKKKELSRAVGTGEGGGVSQVIDTGASAADDVGEIDDTVSETVEVFPTGRQRGRVTKFKGSFGFIKPETSKKTSRDNNAYFTSSLLEEGQKPGVGDLVEYDLVMVKGKPNGINIVVIESSPLKTEVAERAANSSTVVSERPELFKSRLQPVHVRMAKGPDGSMGFPPGFRGRK